MIIVSFLKNKMLNCCQKKICHSQCDPEKDNPFCHDTLCRECRITVHPFEEDEDSICARCGYHICEKCINNKEIRVKNGLCKNCIQSLLNKNEQ